MTERFEQLKFYNQIFGFLYNLRNVDKNTLLEKCNTLQTKLTHNNHSDIDGLQLFQELNMLIPILPSGLEDAFDLLKYLLVNNLDVNFPNLMISLRILLTLPVSVASAERSFSKLKLIKKYLRATMSQERLTGLATLSIELDICDQLDMEEIIKQFSELKARKIVI